MTVDTKDLERAARLVLDAPLEFAMLENEQAAALKAREFTRWKSQVRLVAKSMREERERAAREERASARKQSRLALPDDVPEIERDDNASIAAALIRSFEGEYGESLAYDFGGAWAWDLDRWKPIAHPTISSRLQSWSGVPVPAGVNKDGEETTRPLKVNTIKPIVDMLYDRIADPTTSDRVEGWLSRGQDALAFADGCIAMDGRGKLTHLDNGPHLRTQHVYPFTRAEVIGGDCPKWRSMISAAFAPLTPEHAADSARCFQEWCGAAVMGLATRYHRALVMQGKPGSGKSEIIRVVKALITGYLPPDPNTPDDKTHPSAAYLASVDLAQWKDDNMVNAFTRARLNHTSDISREALREPGRIITIINGEALTIRTVYERSFQFTPRTAHLFATNDLPQVLAGGEFWDRFLLLRIPRRVRGTDEQIEYYGHVVASEELPGIIAWALEGASRLRARGKFDLGTLQTDIETEWRDASNPVAEWASENIKALPGGFTRTQVLRLAFLDWARQRGATGSGEMGERTFTQRLTQLGFVNRKHHTTRQSGFEVEMAGFDDY